MTYCKCGREFGADKGCKLHQILIGNKVYQRIPWTLNPEPCGDCGVKQGMYHHYGCEIEECPKCQGQMIWYNCVDKKEPIK